ncbi:hypothetical protein CANARDRAFT_5325 [[Candida] arabinofermentans NRRL YB-2248]|uniref:RNA polymerase II-associated protein 3 n=1 Tax=[Candida] arabinofermentans NRRL YB-2248 TaxID=983967 RepID=A0A1E4T8D5_9ASCO|nr:hypothetical protein CANARDRAFT_5325 [[Candida] arabinofermentans NRRL YB-2248]
MSSKRDEWKKAIADELKVRGNVAFGAKQYNKAAKIYRDALKIDPSNVTILSNRAMAFIKLGDFLRAVNDCEEALKLGVEDPKVLEKLAFRRSSAHMGLGDIESAVNALKEGLKRLPESTYLTNELRRIQEPISAEPASCNDKKRKRESSKLLKTENDPNPKSHSIPVSSIEAVVELNTNPTVIPIQVVETLPPEFNLSVPKSKSQEITQTSTKSVKDIPILSVDELPIDFREQRSNKQEDKQIDDYEAELLSISGVSLIPKRQLDKNQVKESANDALTIDDEIYPSKPSVHFLSLLRRRPQNEKVAFYKYVMQISVDTYNSLFCKAGVDADFLSFYVEAAINDLSSQGTYLQNIISQVKLFTKMPRFALSAMFLDKDKVDELLNLLTDKSSTDFRSLWEGK